MDLRLTIAIWMFIAMGYLQTAPTKPTVFFKLLQSEVKFNDTVNFTSPTNVKSECTVAALKTIKEQLIHASKTCTAGKERIYQTLDALDKVLNTTTPTDCKWEEPHKNFTDFIAAFKDVVSGYNTYVTNSLTVKIH